MQIKTGCWYAPVPAGHTKVGISRGTPRGLAAGYRIYRVLAPGPWFKSVSIEEYARRYNDEILGPLDPEKTANALKVLGGPNIPVMCCYEHIADIQSGRDFCHRHIVAKWLQDRLGLVVEEVGAPPDFDPWGAFDAAGVRRPSYAPATA